MAFWTDKNTEPLQKYRFQVVTVLYKGKPAYTDEGLFQITGRKSYNIPSRLIKSVNMPDLSLTIDQLAANLQVSQSIITARDPTYNELELKLYMTPALMKDIREMVQTYTQNPMTSKVKTTVSWAYDLINKSNIMVYIYNSSGTLVRKVTFYQVMPTAYNLGDFEHGVSDVVEGSIKFHFNSLLPGAPALTSTGGTDPDQSGDDGKPDAKKNKPGTVVIQ